MRRVLAVVLIGTLVMSYIVSSVSAGDRMTSRYLGRVLYRANKGAVPGVLVELVEAEDDGRPTDEVLGSAHADSEGRFTLVPDKQTPGRVTLVVSAVRESAASGGDHRSRGYEIKMHRTRLGYLPNPSPTKPNTILIERRKPGHISDDSDDN